MEEHTMTADNSWTLQISRDDLSRTRLVEAPLAELEEGEALLRVDRVGGKSGGQ
jgi:hypothetical protein